MKGGCHRRQGYRSFKPRRHRAIPVVDAFREGLASLGLVDGRDIQIEWRITSQGPSRLLELALELAQIPVDVLVTSGVPAALAAQQATSTVPIVFLNSADPGGLGFTEGLERATANITGLSDADAAYSEQSAPGSDP